MAASSELPGGGVEDPLQLFANYHFDSDDAFQQGLGSIFAGSPLEGHSGTEKDEMIRRARVFYFNRITGSSLTPESVAEYEKSISDTRGISEPNTSQIPVVHGQEEVRTLSFAELKALIEEGKTDQIPNNKVISTALNDAPPSQSNTQARRKPWESG